MLNEHTCDWRWTSVRLAGIFAWNNAKVKVMVYRRCRTTRGTVLDDFVHALRDLDCGKANADKRIG